MQAESERLGNPRGFPADAPLHIRFDAVRFAYPHRPEVTVLAGFTLDVPPETTVAFFGGLRLSEGAFRDMGFLDPDYARPAGDEAGTVVYLPQELGRDAGRYRASLGHKINHSFRDWNCLFWSVDHDNEIDRAMLEVEAVSGKDSMNRTVTSFFQVRLRNRYSIVRKWHYRACRRLNC